MAVVFGLWLLLCFALVVCCWNLLRTSDSKHASHVCSDCSFCGKVDGDQGVACHIDRPGRLVLRRRVLRLGLLAQPCASQRYVRHRIPQHSRRRALRERLIFFITLPSSSTILFPHSHKQRPRKGGVNKWLSPLSSRVKHAPSWPFCALQESVYVARAKSC